MDILTLFNTEQYNVQIEDWPYSILNSIKYSWYMYKSIRLSSGTYLWSSLTELQYFVHQKETKHTRFVPRSAILVRSISFVNAFVERQPWPSSLSTVHRKPGWTTGNCCLLKSRRPNARASEHNGDDLHVSVDLRSVTSLTVQLRLCLEKRLRFAKSLKITLYLGPE